MNRFALSNIYMYFIPYMTAVSSDGAPIRILQILRYRSVPVGSGSPAKHNPVSTTYIYRLHPVTSDYPVLRSVFRSVSRIPLSPIFTPNFRTPPHIENGVRFAYHQLKTGCNWCRIFSENFFCEIFCDFFAEFLENFLQGAGPL